MVFKVGSVYRNEHHTHFILAQKHYDSTTNVIQIMFVNAVNWIVVEELTGKLMSDGSISCQQLDHTAYELVAETVGKYYERVRKNKLPQ